MPNSVSTDRKSQDTVPIEAVERMIGYSFTNKTLLTQALTHRSYTNEHKEEVHNERLEFLGDAVLQFISTEELYRRYPDVAEGELSVYRSLLVKTDFLVAVAEALDLPSHLRVSAGQKKDLKTTSVALFADAVEAVIGAIYLDGGLESAKTFVFDTILRDIQEYLARTPLRDAKTALQERTQQDIDITPEYVVLREHGPDHAKIFTIGVHIGGTMYAKGIGKSKQEAAQKAAKQALEEYEKKNSQ